MSEEKYYVPDISEFHVGFEYEWRNRDGFPDDIFKKAIIKNGTQIDYIHKSDNGIDRNYDLRVKYLDRSDIESCGWLFKGVGGQKSIFFKMDGLKSPEWLEGHHISKLKLVYNSTKEYKWIKIIAMISGDEDTLFEGTIKNINELQKLMQQLNISHDNRSI